jgi:hypothetical protein
MLGITASSLVEYLFYIYRFLVEGQSLWVRNKDLNRLVVVLDLFRHGVAFKDKCIHLPTYTILYLRNARLESIRILLN